MDKKELSIEEISEKIKNKNINTSISHNDSRVYQYSDFTKYHNREFIENIYQLLLKKEANSEDINYYLHLLRTGEKSTSEIITLLRFSQEGKKQNTKLLGSQKRFWIMKLFEIPIIGYISKLIVTILTLPKLLKRLNQLEAQSYMEFTNLKLQNNNFMDKLTLNQKANKKELKLALNQKANKEEFKLYLQAVDYAKEYMKLSQQNMQKLIDDVKKRVPNKLLSEDELITITKEERYKFDNFYIEFEDRFRGDRENIKERVKEYLPYIKNLPFEQKDIKLLDVGCGRGEWLEVVSSHGYDAEGIDINRIMVAKSKELGLNAKEIDVIEYLNSLEDNSLSMITGFHIIEHLPFEVLIEMYDEALRVLKPKGMVIFETPNPENVFVGTSNFYTDPTHLNPIPPVTSQFILEQRGYIDVTIKRVSYQDIHYDDPNINHLFASSTDYAVIGYKA